jgi:hypothetical protein
MWKGAEQEDEVLVMVCLLWQELFVHLQHNAASCIEVLFVSTVLLPTQA